MQGLGAGWLFVGDPYINEPMATSYYENRLWVAVGASVARSLRGLSSVPPQQPVRTHAHFHRWLCGIGRKAMRQRYPKAQYDLLRQSLSPEDAHGLKEP